MATAITCHQVKGGDPTTDNYIPVNHGGFFDDGPTHSLTKRMDSSEDGTGRGTPIVAFAQNQLGEVRTGEVTNTLNQNANASGRNTPIGYATLTKNYATHHGRTAGNNGGVAAGQLVPATMSVRRLTPRECERLQGFPDDYTRIPRGKEYIENGIRKQPWAADGPRYKALGNSMAVPVMRWIGERIALVDSIPSSLIPHPSSL